MTQGRGSVEVDGRRTRGPKGLGAAYSNGETARGARRGRRHRGIDGGELHDELTAAAAAFTASRHLAAMKLGRVRKREAETEPPSSAGKASLPLHEQVEDARQQVGLDADPSSRTVSVSRGRSDCSGAPLVAGSDCLRRDRYRIERQVGPEGLTPSWRRGSYAWGRRANRLLRWRQ